MSRRLVLNFHGIGEPGPEVPPDEVAYWCPRPLWPVLADALAQVRDGGRFHLQLTFDDGNLSDYEEALPVLLERGLSATFFVCAGRIGQPGYLGAAELTALREAGMGVGSHGWGHTDLRWADEASLEREVVTARAALAEAAGAPVEGFAIPFGSYDARVLGRLRDYREVYTSDGGLAGSSKWLIPRSSYVRGWQPQTISDLSQRRAWPGEQLLRRARRFQKGLRRPPAATATTPLR